MSAQTRWGWLAVSGGAIRAVRQLLNLATSSNGSTPGRATAMFNEVEKAVADPTRRGQAAVVFDRAGRRFRRMPVELFGGKTTLRVYLVELEVGLAIAAITDPAADEQRMLDRIELASQSQMVDSADARHVFEGLVSAVARKPDRRDRRGPKPARKLEAVPSPGSERLCLPEVAAALVAADAGRGRIDLRDIDESDVSQERAT